MSMPPRAIHQKRMTEATAYAVTDALYDLALDSLEALSRALRERGMTLGREKADRIIEELNKCLGGEYAGIESGSVRE